MYVRKIYTSVTDQSVHFLNGQQFFVEYSQGWLEIILLRRVKLVDINLRIGLSAQYIKQIWHNKLNIVNVIINYLTPLFTVYALLLNFFMQSEKCDATHFTR